MNRDVLRSLTLGAPQRELRRVKVFLRDSTKAKVLEDDVDIDGEVVMKQSRDADGEPLVDADGNPRMEVSRSRRYPRAIAADGTEAFVEVREPNLRTRDAILKAATTVEKDGKFTVNSAKLQVEAVITLTYQPGSAEIRVFEEADRARLLSLPAGSFVDDIYEVCTQLMNLSGVDEKEIEKNSKGTASV